MRWLLLFAATTLFAPPLRAQAPAGYPAPEKVRADFLKLLDRAKVPLDVKAGSTKNLGDGLILEQVSFASEKKADGTMERVPAILMRPEQQAGKRPAVLVLHGTGGSKEGMTRFLKALAKRGITGVAIDARYHGARSGSAGGAKAYNAAIVRAWQAKPGVPMEHPFFYDTCWDIWRTVDYLETRPDVDAAKLGIIGFSMGGIETWLAAAVDERLRVSVPAIGVQSFRWSLDHDQWQGRARTIHAAHVQAAEDLREPAINRRVCQELWNKIVPGILDEFDCPSMIRLFAGRPLLILNGTKDSNCPYEGAKLAIAAAERAFQEAGTSDRLRVMVEDVGHRVTAEQSDTALAWLARWLK